MSLPNPFPLPVINQTFRHENPPFSFLDRLWALRLGQLASVNPSHRRMLACSRYHAERLKLSNPFIQCHWSPANLGAIPRQSHHGCLSRTQVNFTRRVPFDGRGVVSCETYRRVDPGRQTAKQKLRPSAHDWFRTVERKLERLESGCN
jgi:hypothetical protein